MKEFREHVSDAFAGVFLVVVNLFPVAVHGPVCVPLVHMEARHADLAQADVRQAPQDQLQNASIGELDDVECPAVQRIQDVFENFAGQGGHCGSFWLRELLKYTILVGVFK